MDKLIRDALIALRAMWRYRWLGLVTAWVIAVIGSVAVMSIPKKYEASARVFVNTDSILKPLMVGMTVQPDTNQRVSMLSHIVISRPNVEQIVKLSGLDEKAKTQEDRDKVVDEVLKVLEIKEAGHDNLFVLTFLDRKPERAKKVVELLVSKFIDTNNGGKTNDTDAAKQFLDEQVAVYEKKLEDTENRLKDFKLRNLGVGPTEGKDHFVQMAETSAMLNQAQLQLREAENSRDAFRRGLASEEPYLGQNPGGATAGGESLSDIDARIDSMRRNLDGLLQKYTDSHPDVIGTRRMIGELEEQRRQLLLEHQKNGVPLAPPAAGGGQRASEQLKVSLAQAEANVASLRTRVGEYSARYNRLREAAKMMPQLEAEYAQLNRDYDVDKKNYESLLARRESAGISGEMQSVSGVADFRLIDPPRVSRLPVSPNRALLLPLVVLAALGAGLAVAFVATEVRPTFFDALNLREITGLPVLGTVSMIVSDSMALESKMKLKKFLTCSLALFGVYVVIMVAAKLLTAQTV